MRENPEEQRRKYDALKKKYPTEEERAQRESQKSVAKKKDKDAPNKIRAKHIEGMKTRPESDFVYYSQIKFDDFSPDELKTARENLSAAKKRYQEIIQKIDNLQQKIDIQKAQEAEKSKAS